MRLFGILLIVANLLAGGAFVYFATQDWKGRQAINATGLRHLLVLQGLPLEGEDFRGDDETPFVVELGGGESTKTVSKKLLESYFNDNKAPAAAATGADPAAPAAAAPVSLATGAPAVTNQIAEVKRVQGLIKAELAKDLAPADKLALLRGWLLFQAETLTARNEYLALAALVDANGQPKSADQLKTDAAKLEEILDARFAAVINKPDGTLTVQPVEMPPELATATDALQKKWLEWKKLQAEDELLANEREKLAKEVEKADAAQKAAIEAKRAALQAKRVPIQEKMLAKGKEILPLRQPLEEKSKEARSKFDQALAQRPTGTLDQTDRRLRLAHLLVHLDPDPVWQKRVAIVVGLRRYVQAISRQTLRFKDMIDDIELGIPRDQAVYAAHEDQLRVQAAQGAERARIVAEEKAKLVEQKTKEDDAVNRQRTQLKELTDQLAKIKGEVDELLVRQSGIEKQLFEIQREVGLTLEEVYRLEELLDATERERFGLPPRPRP